MGGHAPVTAASTPLAGLTTMRVGGPAARLVTTTSREEIISAVQAADEAGEPVLLLSGGSNLVVADAGFEGTVVRIASRGIQVSAAGEYIQLRVAAGHRWDDLVAEAVASGWSGIEALSGIPGATGATPMQNVGAYGQDVSQTITQVHTWDRLLRRPQVFQASACRFGYRTSRFKQEQLPGRSGEPGPRGPRHVVLEVVFQLAVGVESASIGYADLARQVGAALGDRVPLALAREGVLAQRRARGMVLDDADHDTWSCGSFFTNPTLGEQEFTAMAARVRRRCGPCLLYTSPSPRDGLLSRMPSSA